jgi:hypothetical protein
MLTRDGLIVSHTVALANKGQHMALISLFIHHFCTSLSDFLLLGGGRSLLPHRSSRIPR